MVCSVPRFAQFLGQSAKLADVTYCARLPMCLPPCLWGEPSHYSEREKQPKDKVFGPDLRRANLRDISPYLAPNTGGSPQPPRSKPLDGRNRAIVVL